MIVTNRRSIIWHENYNDNTLVNDIGLVELPQNAPVEHPYVGILSLPSGADRERFFYYYQAVSSGFGEIT